MTSQIRSVRSVVCRVLAESSAAPAVDNQPGPQRHALRLASGTLLLLLAACGGGNGSGASPAAAPTAVAAAASAASAEATRRSRILATAPASNAWVTLPSIADPLLQNLAIPADAPQRGMWSARCPGR
jgi:hypothetical protein